MIQRISTIIIALISPALLSAQVVFEQWRAGETVTLAQVEQYGINKCFAEEPISDTIFARMYGKSYKAQCTIPRSELRYIRVLHITENGEIRLGEMVANKAISEDLVAIFKELFVAEYPIEKMVLVDNYNADDNASMRDNNSSAFNYREIPTGGRLSAHSRGMAVDINPLYNPYVKQLSDRVIIAPIEGSEYVERSGAFSYKIEDDDICCRLFKQYGFEWGGDYKTIKDYQHFEKR